MVVTRISEQQKNADRVSVYVDTRYSFSLTINQLLEAKLKVGTELTDADIKDYLRLSDEGKLRVRTYDWLTLRPRSEKELTDYLRKKAVAVEAIPTWVADFKQKHYQDDASFAVWWVEQRRRQLRSESYIRQELRTKGFSQEIIANVLGTSDISDEQVLKDLITKKQKQIKYQDNQKLLEYLVRKGYRYSLVKEALAE